jgi:hypothetical protein
MRAHKEREKLEPFDPTAQDKTGFTYENYTQLQSYRAEQPKINSSQNQEEHKNESKSAGGKTSVEDRWWKQQKQPQNPSAPTKNSRSRSWETCYNSD